MKELLKQTVDALELANRMLNWYRSAFPETIDDVDKVGAHDIAVAIEALKAKLAEPEQEPEAYMFQHDETGRMTFVDLWQVENGWEERNPRYKLVGPLYTAPQDSAAIAALKRIAACEDAPDIDVSGAWQRAEYGYAQGMERGLERARNEANHTLAKLCFCDARGIGEPGVSCGDCPTRDYK